MAQQPGQPRPPPAPVFHPPTDFEVPRTTVTNLETKLNMTFREIENLLAELSMGRENATLMAWNDIVARYSSILGRLAELNSEINRVPPPKRGEHIDPTAPVVVKPPITQHYLVHPANAIPDTNAQLLAMSTMPIAPPGEDKGAGTGKGQDRGPMHVAATAGLLGAELEKMDEAALERHLKVLRGRWEAGARRSKAVLEEVDQAAGEYDWKMRVETLDAEGEEGDEEGEKDEDEEDLFGDDGDEEMGKEEEKALPNPREGWTIKDYLAFMDAGTVPEPPQVSQPPQPPQPPQAAAV